MPLAGRPAGAEGDALVYRARARVGGRWVDVEAGRELADDEGLDAWADATTVEFSASTGETGTLRLGPLDAARALSTAEPVGAHGGSTGPARWPGWPHRAAPGPDDLRT